MKFNGDVFQTFLVFLARKKSIYSWYLKFDFPQSINCSNAFNYWLDYRQYDQPDNDSKSADKLGATNTSYNPPAIYSALRMADGNIRNSR